MADLVMAGNDYLANYARQWNGRVEVVPTTIDTDEYQAVPGTKMAPFGSDGKPHHHPAFPVRHSALAP